MSEVTGLRNNALAYPVYSLAYGVTFPLLDADGDPVSPSSPDSEVSLNGDTFADCTNEAVEIATSSGICYLLLTAAEMTADVVTIKIASTGAKTTILTLYPRKLVVLTSGTCQGSNDTGDIQLASTASAIDDYFNGCLAVAVIDGVTEARMGNDYVGATKVLEVNPPWVTAQPDSDDTYTIYLPEGRQVQQANTTHVNAIPATSVTTINANLGTTQPVNFDGTGSTAFVKGDLRTILGQSTYATYFGNLLSFGWDNDRLALRSLEGRTWYVSTTGNDSNSGQFETDAFLTVSHAISVASPGDIIDVGAGTFSGALSNTKNRLTIIGAGIGSTILTHNSGATFTHTGSHIRLRCMTITSTDAVDGIGVVFGDGVSTYYDNMIDGVRIVGCYDSFQSLNQADLKLRNGAAEGTFDGVYVAASSIDGENWLCKTDGTYGDPGAEGNRGLIYAGDCTLTFSKSCRFIATRAAAQSWGLHAFQCGETTSLSKSHISLNDSLLSATALHASDTGQVSGLSSAIFSGTRRAYRADLKGCRINTSSANGAMTPYDIIAPSGTKVQFDGACITESKLSGTVNLIDGGADWSKVRNPTTTNALSSTTIGTVNAVADGALTAAKFASGALNGKGDWNTTTPPTAAANADAVAAQTDIAAALSTIDTNLDAKVSEVEGGGSGGAPVQPSLVAVGKQNIFVLVNGSDGFVSESVMKINRSDASDYYSVDFRNDCAVNQKVQTVGSLTFVDGDSGDITVTAADDWAPSVHGGGTRFTFAMTPSTIGEYSIRLNDVTLYPSGSSTGIINFEIV